MLGVSTRKYASVLPEMAETVGVSKSEVSREFVEASAEQLQGLMERPLDELEIAVVYLDGIRFGEHHALAAIGVDTEGYKHVLGLRDGASENQIVCKALLEDLVERGLSPERCRLWFRKNAIHRFTSSGSARRRGMYRDTVISLTTNPSFVSSAWIRGATPAVLGHRADETTNLGINPRSTWIARTGDPSPVSVEPISIPPGDRVGVHDNEPARPRWPRASERNPECSVRVLERWPGALLLQRRNLLPQGQVFNHEVGSAPTHRPDRTGAE